MVSRVATLRLQLLDQVSGPSKTTTAALRNLESSITKLGAKGTPGAKNLVNQLDFLQQKSAAVGRFTELRKGLAGAFGEFRAARARVKELEAALASAAKPTAKMNADLRSAQTALKQASAAYQEKRTAVASAANALSVYGTNSRDAASAQQQARSGIAGTIRQMREMERTARRAKEDQDVLQQAFQESQAAIRAQTSVVASHRARLEALASSTGKVSSAMRNLEGTVTKLGARGAPGARDIVNQLEFLREKSAAVGRFTELRSGLGQLYGDFRTARARVRELEAALASATRPTAKMNADLRSSRSALKQATAAYQEQRTAVTQAANALKVFGAGTRNIAGTQKQVRSELAQTIRKMREMDREARKSRPQPPAPVRQRQPVGRYADAPASAVSDALDAGATAGGYGLMRGAGRAMAAGAHQEAMINRIRNVSNDEREVESARAIARETNAAHPSTSQEAALADYVELRAIAGTGDSTRPIDEDLMRRNVLATAKARAALGSSGFDLSDYDSQNLGKALDITGRAADPKAYEQLLDAFVRGKQTFGGAVTSDAVRDFTANAKASNFSMSDDAFFKTVMVRLSQGNASRLGNQFAQTMSTLVGGRMLKQGAIWLSKIGLIDEDQIKSGEGGKFYIEGDIKEHGLLSTDQTAWSQKVLLPGLKEAGVLSDERVEERKSLLRTASPKASEHELTERAAHGLIADALMKSGFRSTVVDNLAHAIGNEISIERGRQQMAAAKGLDAADSLDHNPVAALGELGKAITNFGAVLTSPAAATAGQHLHALAGGVNRISQAMQEWQQRNPKLAEATGYAAPAAAVAGGAWLTWRAARSLMERFTGVAAERGAGAAAGGAAAKAAPGLIGRAVSSVAAPVAVGAVGLEAMGAADPQGNLWGLTKPVDSFVKRNTGLNPANVFEEDDKGVPSWKRFLWGKAADSDFDWRQNLSIKTSVRERSQAQAQEAERNRLQAEISKESASWPAAAQQGIQGYIQKLTTGGADAEAKAQQIGEQIKELLTVDGKLTIDTSDLERAIGLARQYAEAVRSLPGVPTRAPAPAGGAPTAQTVPTVPAAPAAPVKVDGHRARGGPVQAGKIYEVGERGRELFSPSTDGVIIPNHDVPAALGGSAPPRGATDASSGRAPAPVAVAPSPMATAPAPGAPASAQPGAVTAQPGAVTINAPITITVNIKAGDGSAGADIAAQVEKATRRALNEAFGQLNRTIMRRPQVTFGSTLYGDF